MTKTVTVASRMHTAIRISEPAPRYPLDGDNYPPQALKTPDGQPVRHPDAPRKTAVINGARHPATPSEIGITHGVDADLFRGWLAANQELAANGMIYEVTDDEATTLGSHIVANGFQPGLAKVQADNESADATNGSTLTGAGTITAKDMMAHSEAPNDDSPRSDVDPNAPHTALSTPTV